MGKQIAEIKIKTSEENAEKHQKKKAAYFYWKYDDGRYILCGTKAKNMLPATTITNAELKEKKRGKGKFKKLRIENGFLDGLTGTEILNYRKDDFSVLSEAFSDIKQLVEDYALEVKSTEVLRLFTYILSGYTYRLFMKDFGKRAMFSFRAPVVLITPSKKDFSGGFEHLENLMECFSYDTSLDHNLIHTNPAVLPDNYLATTITECAYMQIRDNEKLGLFPAQYRDTTVLLHSSFFKKSDLVEFVKRNVWASVLIFGGPVPNVTFSRFGIDLNLMNLSKRNWDSEESEQIKKRINDLISSFSIWIHGISCTSDAYLRMLRWMDTGNLAVRKYNLAISTTDQPVLQGSQAHYYGVQMATLRAFLDFCLIKNVIDQETADSTWDAWANEILPGSRTAEIFHKKESERLRKVAEENDRWRTKCEDLFREFLESATDDMIAKRTEVDWNSFNREKYYRDRFCVFVDSHEARKTREGSFPAVKIMRADLEQFSSEHENRFRDVIAVLWKNSNKSELPYLYSSNNVTFSDSLNINAVVLRMNQLSFLKPECLEKLRDMVEPEDKAKKSRQN